MFSDSSTHRLMSGSKEKTNTGQTKLYVINVGLQKFEFKKVNTLFHTVSATSVSYRS